MPSFLFFFLFVPTRIVYLIANKRIIIILIIIIISIIIIINNNISVNSARNKDESYSNKNKNPSLKGLPKEKQEMKKSAFSKNPSVKAPANQQKFR